MQTIAIISDTHGNRELMDSVISFINTIHRADTLFHLGDSYADGIYMKEQLSIESIVVPGIYCDEYGDIHIPNIVEQEICGRKTALVHSVGDCKQLKAFDVVFCGHSHIPDITEEDGTLIINPGHLKEDISKGRACSYGLLKTEDTKLIFEWYHPCEKPVLCRREILETI